MSVKAFLQRRPTVRQSSRAVVLPKCGSCGLYQTCKTPKMPVKGKGRKGILVVGDAPRSEADKEGLPISDDLLDMLETALDMAGVHLKKDCWYTNSLICSPGHVPTEKEIEYCRPNLISAITKLKPTTIILLGANPLRSVIKWTWKENAAIDIRNWTGWRIPDQKTNAWICPTYHPSTILALDNPELAKVYRNAFNRHIADAVVFEGKPWKKLPNFESQVEIIMDSAKAAKIIRSFTKEGGKATFDYETNMLKPDSRQAKIICCSVCFKGKRTIAFPWMGKAIEAMDDFLSSPNIEKIACNSKFEERWTHRMLGHGVENWFYCTMLGAHWLDTRGGKETGDGSKRSGITGLKFQSYVRLGQPAYNEKVEKFLKAETSNSKNNIREIDKRDLLLYCGMDSVLEYHVAKLQLKEHKERKGV